MRNPLKYRLAQNCEDLAVRAYAVTAEFPRYELFGLTSQIRRGAVSIGANFSEGCGRQGDRAFLPFLHNSLGSANEIQFELRVAQRLGFGHADDLMRFYSEVDGVGKQVASFITSIRRDLK